MLVATLIGRAGKSWESAGPEKGVHISKRLKSELGRLSTGNLVTKVSRFRPGTNLADVEAATKFALRSVARRHKWLSEEISELDEQLDRLVAEAAPELLAM